MGRKVFGPRICVVGAGVMGMSSAYCLAREYPGACITVCADEFSPNTTSNYGFGIVFCKHYDERVYNRKIGEWSGETSRHCSEVAKNYKLSQEMGIKPVDGYLVMSRKELQKIAKDPGQESIVHSPNLRASTTYFRESTNAEIREKFLSKNVKFDVLLDQPKEDTTFEDLLFYSYGTFIIDTNIYLTWLMNSLLEMENRGELQTVKFKSMRITHLNDLCEQNYDFVVNCSGLGAGKIADDERVLPIRAQWTLVSAPYVKNLYYGGRTCICPRPGRVALGSVFHFSRDDMEIDPSVTEDNWRRARSIFPEIEESQILGEYVRLRPGRVGGARLEMERMIGGSKPLTVIHNYGHAGTGIGQHWGCALDVVKIAKSLCPTRKSKL